MKTLKQILKQKPIYLNDWTSKIDLISDFEDISLNEKEYNSKVAPYPNEKVWLERKEKMNKAIKDYEVYNILFASYGCANYEGDAFVLLEKEGKLYEVNGSHCSCYGLEGQFDSEETSLESLQFRLINGKLGNNEYSGNEFANELKQFLGI